MSKVQLFESEIFGTLRAVADENGTPWFFGKDVALALKYTNPQKAIRDHVDEEDKTVNVSFTVNGTAPVLINESGVWSLTFCSKLQKAKEFKHWITSEVVPQIRRTGGYLPTRNQQGKPMSDMEIMARAYQITLRTIDQKDAIIAAQQPAVVFKESVEASVNSIYVVELAKLISQNGIEIGQNILFRWLRDNGYLCQRDGYRNQPKQRYVDQGLFEVHESTYSDKYGKSHTSRTTKVTGKGQTYFVNVFLNRG